MEQISGVGGDSFKVQIVSGQPGHLEEFGRAPTPPREKSRSVPSSELPDDDSLLVAFKTRESGIELEYQINNDGSGTGLETGTRHSGDPVLEHDNKEDVTVEASDDVDIQTAASISGVCLEGR